MLSRLVKFQVKVAALRSDRGATAVEYGLMVALIAVVILLIHNLVHSSSGRRMLAVRVCEPKATGSAGSADTVGTPISEGSCTICTPPSIWPSMRRLGRQRSTRG